MTAHALLWCGLVKPARRSRRGGHQGGASYDFAASLQDLTIACLAAGALGIAPTDVHAFVCASDLLPDGFRGSRYPATRAALSSLLQTLPREDALFFVATNHGELEGLLTSESVDELDEGDGPPLSLSPRELGEMLAERRGPQVLVIAACHAGIFLELGSDKRAVITSCSADEKYYPTGGERICSPLLPAFLGAWTGAAFESEPTPPHDLDLEAAFDAATRSLAAGCEGRPTTVPLRSGAAIWPARGGR